jgi:hypothetical protein
MGQQFRAARERKRINISRAAALTRIKVQHLEMMENDDFSTMPAPTYAKGFIRIYAGFLGLDPAPLVQEYVDRHQNAPAPQTRKERVPNKTKPAKTSTPVIRKIEDEPEVGQAPPPRREKSAIDFLPQIKRRAKAFLALLPRLIALLAIVGVLFLMGRCAIRLGSMVPDESSSSGELLNPEAIMREPSDRYLDVPVTEESKP